METSLTSLIAEVDGWLGENHRAKRLDAADTYDLILRMHTALERLNREEGAQAEEQEVLVESLEVLSRHAYAHLRSLPLPQQFPEDVSLTMSYMSIRSALHILGPEEVAPHVD